MMSWNQINKLSFIKSCGNVVKNVEKLYVEIVESWKPFSFSISKFQ